MSKKGFTLIELLVVFFIVTILIVVIISWVQWSQKESVYLKCSANLDIIGKSFKLYAIDFGRAIEYPKRNGAGFLSTLYEYEILVENQVYICPSTEDKNEGIDLTKIIHHDTKQNYISYSGRKNKNQNKYPGIFTSNTITIISSDDTQGKPNHKNNAYMIFLFLDGHSERVKSKNANWNDYSYHFDPLTN